MLRDSFELIPMENGISAERRHQATVVLSMYVGYAWFMVLRSAPGAVVTAIRTDIGLTKGEWGQVLAISTAGAVVGKIIGGFLADKIGGRATFAIGLIGCSWGITAFGTSVSLGVLQVTFFLALLAKSFGWPAMTRIVGATIAPSEWGRAWGILSTSSRVGAILASVGLGALIAVAPWRTVLAVVGGTGVLVAGLFAVIQKHAAAKLAGSRQQNADSPNAHAELAVDPLHPLYEKTVGQALWRFACSRQFWLITVSLTGMTILWDFLQILPLFLQDTLNMSDSGASVAASAFPWGSLLSVLAGGFLFDAMSGRRMAWAMGGLLFVATCCVGAFYAMQYYAPPTGTDVSLSVVILFIYGVCIAPCYYIPMSIFSIRFGGMHAGFLVALLDAIAFGGNAGFQLIGGELADRGWDQYLLLLGSVAFVSAVTMFAFMLGEAREHDHQRASSID